MRQLVLLALIASLGCSTHGLPVQIVVPTGFSGEIQIVHDVQNGQAVMPTNGRYVYVIPPDGVLQVKSLHPFSPWHRETANFVDGTPLPFEYETCEGPRGEPATVGKEATVLCGGGMSAGMNKPTTITYFVGSTEEYDRWSWEQVGIRPDERD